MDAARKEAKAVVTQQLFRKGSIWLWERLRHFYHGLIFTLKMGRTFVTDDWQGQEVVGRTFGANWQGQEAVTG